MIATFLLASNLAMADSLVINEFMPNPEGADSGHEWVELYNPRTEPVSLAGWSLEVGKSGGFSPAVVVFDASITIGPLDFFLVGEESVPDADVISGLNLGNAGSNADMVRLIDSEGIAVDTLVYGSPNEDAWVDDSGSVATSLAAKPPEGQSLARRLDGYDTDASADDWTLATEVTPGASNPTIDPLECVVGALQIKINEFLPNPDGSDADSEWIELYNKSDVLVSLEGWRLQWGKNGSYSGELLLDSGTQVAALSWMLIGGSEVAGTDLVAELDLGNAGSNSDALRLVDCEGVVQDTVVYGSPNDDGWLDDNAEVAESLAPSPGSGVSIGRTVDGADTDASGIDFVEQSDATPGGANEPYTPIVCEPGEQDIKINEVLPDPEGTDQDSEFIELYNISSEELSIEGWVIATGTSSWPSEADFRFPAGARIAAGGFVLVAGSEVPGADFYNDDDNEFMLGNGSSAPDGVRLEDCTGEVQDTVLYGDPADPIEDVELGDDRGLATMATMPGDGLTMGRYPNGQDSDDNAVDFVSNTTPTPGAPNVRSAEDDAESDGTEGDADGDIFDPGSWGDDTGREWDVEDTKPGCGACASAGQGPPVWWTWLPLMVCVGRRRQSTRLS